MADDFSGGDQHPAEQLALGLLLGNYDLLQEAPTLRDEHFRHKFHARLFRAAVFSRDKGEKPNIETFRAAKSAKAQYFTKLIDTAARRTKGDAKVAKAVFRDCARRIVGAPIQMAPQEPAPARAVDPAPRAAAPPPTVVTERSTIAERAVAAIRPKTKTPSDRHVRLYHVDLETPAFASLDCYARALLVEFHRKYDGHNNGEITLPVKVAMSRLGIGSEHTILRAFRALEERGWIVAISKGAFNAGAKIPTKWELTCWPIAKGAEPRRLFRKWHPRLQSEHPMVAPRATDGCS
jgi:hypothetical protein